MNVCESTLGKGRLLSRRTLLLGGITTVASLVSMSTAGCSPAAAPTPTTAPKAASQPAVAPTAQPQATTPAIATQAPVTAGQAKPFAGTNLNVATFEHLFSNAIKDYLPDLEQKTGIKATLDIQGFAVYNQRADLELSTKGSAYDVMNITMIYAGRWIGSGWFTNLEEFIKDANKTPKEWDPDDFAAGPMVVMRDKKGDRYGFPWEAASTITGASRGDLLEKAGFKELPKTMDDLMKAVQAVHDIEGCKAFVNDNNHHWNLPAYVMGLGGKVLKDPPDNVTPMLDSPEFIQAAEWYANLLGRYSPEGVLSFTDDQALQAQKDGRANIRAGLLSYLVPVGDPAVSKTAKTARFGPIPAGPKGAFPQVASHAYGIPINAKKKDASWEFIKWAMSKETLSRVVSEKGWGTPNRMSLINSAAYKQRMTINGQDVAALYADVLDTAGKGGYMKYRVVPVFPQVGAAINKAISTIASKQMSAEAAMKQAQQEAIRDIKNAGVTIDV
jgi:multiple sugar transport system substrate-binding protein